MNDYYSLIMNLNKRKTMQIDFEEENSTKQCRSSLAVNLSYTNLTDSGHGSLKKNQSINNESSINHMQLFNELPEDNEELDKIRHLDKSSSRCCTINKKNSITSRKDKKILQDVCVRIVDIKHLRKTDRDYEKLRTAILNKTKELFNKQDECVIKTNLVLANDNNSIDNKDERQIVTEKITSNDDLSPTSGKSVHSGRLSIFSTPVNKSPNLLRVINSSKITARKLFKHVDIIDHCNVKTLTEIKPNLEYNLPSTSIINRNHNTSPILTGSDKKHCISKRSFKNISRIASKSNIQEYQDSLSSLSISTDGTGNIGMPIFSSTFNEEFNIKDRTSNEEYSVNNQNLKDRNVNVMSMELTSLQEHRTVQGRSVFIEKINATNTNSKCKEKDENTKKNKEKSKIQQVKSNSPAIIFQFSQHSMEKNGNMSMSNNSEKHMKDHSLSLNVNTSMDNEAQDKSNSKNLFNKEMKQISATTARSSLQVNTSLNSTYKRKQSYNKEQQSIRKPKQHLLHDGKTISECNDYSSYIECTPYPAPRTVQLKSQLICNTVEKNIKSNYTETVDVPSKSNIQKKNDNFSNLRNKTSLPKTPITHSIMCTGKETNIVHNSIIVSDSPINALDKQQYKEVIINDTLNGTELSKDKTQHNNSKNVNMHSKPNKKKLLPLCENSILSISPREELEHFSPKEPSVTKKQKKFKKTKNTQKFLQQHLYAQINPTTSALENHDSDSSENNFLTHQKQNKECKKFKKVISKKIVIKKRADSDILKRLENFHTFSDQKAEFLESRDSMNEFQTKKEVTQHLLRKSQKITMVITGFSNGDKNLIKNIVKTLGMARIESNVTRRTTHVITTGVRTLNLLYGIIRGCWLLKLEWVLKSLENNGWLNPEEYEVTHFSKAVQENRKDRVLFGMSYVPELFTTCGFLYVEDKTTPSSCTLKELIKTAGGRITENPQAAKIIIGANGVKESWVLDSITTGELQSITQYLKK